MLNVLCDTHRAPSLLPSLQTKRLSNFDFKDGKKFLQAGMRIMPSSFGGGTALMALFIITLSDGWYLHTKVSLRKMDGGTSLARMKDSKLKLLEIASSSKFKVKGWALANLYRDNN
jgi:hypothetical protein